ncbi:MAG: FAD-binding oxidoreductase [Fimbriimonadaceae bacterium]
MARGGNLSFIQPESIAEFKEAIRAHDRLQIAGSQSRQEWVHQSNHAKISTKRWTGIMDYRPDDLVVTVKTGTPLDELVKDVEKRGLTIPGSADWGVLGNRGGTVGGWVATGLPHGWEVRWRSVRDWVLQTKCITASGEEFTSGAQVVKSVAGFDLHRAAVGSRGGLFLITEITLRLAPARAVISFEELEFKPDYIGRMRLSEIPNEAPLNTRICRETGNVWTANPGMLSKMTSWMGRDGARSPFSPDLGHLERRMKEVFDPEMIFAEGWRR